MREIAREGQFAVMIEREKQIAHKHEKDKARRKEKDHGDRPHAWKGTDAGERKKSESAN